MSQISIYKHKITNLDALRKICLMKGYTFIKAGENGVEEKVTGVFYDEQERSGIAFVRLPKWKYPLIIDNQGQIHYDNFGSKSGSMEQFGDMLQDYNMEAVKRRIDTTLWNNISTETENGDIKMKLTIY